MLRFDTSTLNPKVVINDDGTIKGEAIVTRTGVFTYVNKDGTLRKELRLPEEVFKDDSIESLKMLPITNNHPKERIVTPDNAKELTIGFTGETVNIDDSNVSVSIRLTTDEALNVIKKGKKQLSLGYYCDTIEQAGVYNDESYTHIQRNIKYNHLAIVDTARAGKIASLNLDSEEDAILLEKNDGKEIYHVSLEKIKLDGLSYEAQPEVIKYVEKLQAKLDSKEVEAEATKKELGAKLDATQAKLDQAEKELETVKLDFNEEKVNILVKERLSLYSTAKSILNDEAQEKMDEMSNLEIKKAVITSLNPEVNLDDKSEIYVAARFDAAVEFHEKTSKDSVLEQNRKALKADSATSSVKLDSEAVRLKAIEDIKQAYSK